MSNNISTLLKGVRGDAYEAAEQICRHLLEKFEELTEQEMIIFMDGWNIKNEVPLSSDMLKNIISVERNVKSKWDWSIK